MIAGRQIKPLKMITAIYFIDVNRSIFPSSLGYLAQATRLIAYLILQNACEYFGNASSNQLVIHGSEWQQSPTI
jgi:hypothetical protein